jgi:hypothetical protein
VAGFSKKTGVETYFDTAYIAKCYLTEPDGGKVRELSEALQVCVAEVACVFHRQVRQGSLDASGATFLLTASKT